MRRYRCGAIGGQHRCGAIALSRYPIEVNIGAALSQKSVNLGCADNHRRSVALILELLEERIQDLPKIDTFHLAESPLLGGGKVV